jgi:hypothetical protein
MPSRNEGENPVTDATVTIPDNVPHIVHEGRYRLYEKPDGTLRVQYRRDDKTEDDFFEVPGMMVKLAKSAAEGKISPLEMMKAGMKNMRGIHDIQ